MKLQELAAPHKTKQVSKVFESYFGNSFSFDQLSIPQTRNMLKRIKNLINEHRRQPNFHHSEKNVAYLKLVMLEQGLTSKLKEETPMMPATSAGATTPNPAAATNIANSQAAAKAAKMSMLNKVKDPKLQGALKKSMQGSTLNPGEQQLVANAAMASGGAMVQQEGMKRSLQRRLKEASEVQQAQVVLASKDMVDQVQKMIEQTTSIQFKDLPALVDQIRNEVGYEQATQFNGDATTALSGLVQNLQQAKGQLEQALGVVTGQAPQVPGAADLAAPAPDAGADLGAELPPPEGGEDLDLDVDVDAEEEPGAMAATLGRGKR